MAKERYANYIVEQENVEPMLLELLERDETMDYDSGGKYWLFPVQLPGGESVGAATEGGNLPGGPEGSIALRGAQGRINPKLNYLTERITGLTEASITKGVKGFFDALDRSIESKTKYARNDMSRQMWGTGRGNLGAVQAVANGAGTNDRVTLTADSNMQYIRHSMRVDFWTSTLVTRNSAANQTTLDVGFNVTNVNYAARTFDVVDNAGAPVNLATIGQAAVVATNVVVRENVGIGTGATGEGNEITGLQQLVDDGTLTVAIMEFINRTTTPEWRSHIDANGGTLRNITEDLMQSMDDTIQTFSGKEVTFIGMGKGQRRKLIAIGLPQVQHLSAKLHLGYTEIDWNGKKFFIDRQAPLREIYMGNLAQICRFIVKPWGSIDKVAGGERLPHRDVAELAYGTYMNIGIKQSNAWGRIRDLAEP